MGLAADKRWDVMVVGLGPAGAAAAARLAREGARVLALDGRPRRPKPCGGCLSARALEIMAFLEPPAWLREHPVNRVWLTAPGRRPCHARTASPGAYFVDRARLDDFFRERAQEAGAVVLRSRARALGREGGLHWLRTGGGVHRAPWLIGADGAGGLTGRVLGLGRTGLKYAALVEERPLRDARLARMLERSALLELGGVEGGYAWAFLRGDILNLGLAGWAWRNRSTANLARRYGRFLARHGLGPAGRWRGAMIPCPDGRPPRLVSGRAAVAGDAAAAADPFLGEGIGQAVLSGYLAAGGVVAGDLSLYAREMEATMFNEHAHARLLARLIYGAPGVFQSLARRHPGGIELAWEVLRGQRGFTGIWGGVARRGLPKRFRNVCGSLTPAPAPTIVDN